MFNVYVFGTFVQGFESEVYSRQMFVCLSLPFPLHKPEKGELLTLRLYLWGSARNSVHSVDTKRHNCLICWDFFPFSLFFLLFLNFLYLPGLLLNTKLFVKGKKTKALKFGTHIQFSNYLKWRFGLNKHLFHILQQKCLYKMKNKKNRLFFGNL